jgi:hypothetical protein
MRLGVGDGPEPLKGRQSKAFPASLKRCRDTESNASRSAFLGEIYDVPNVPVIAALNRCESGNLNWAEGVKLRKVA